MPSGELGGDLLLMSGSESGALSGLNLGESSRSTDHANVQLGLRPTELWGEQLPEKREEAESVCSVPEANEMNPNYLTLKGKIGCGHYHVEKAIVVEKSQLR